MECHFCFGPATSFFSGAISNCPLLFPGVQWHIGHLPSWGALIMVSYLFVFSYCSFTARILEWVAISSSSGPSFVRTLYYDPSILGGPAWHGSASLSYPSPFTNHYEAMIHEGVLNTYNWLNSKGFRSCWYASIYMLLYILMTIFWERVKKSRSD